MKAKYAISLHPDAKPFAISCPRRVPIPLLPAVRHEIQTMEDLEMIERIEHATQCCVPMVIAKEKSNSLRICVDYAELNNRVIMLTVEESLAKLVDVHVSCKLATNAGLGNSARILSMRDGKNSGTRPWTNVKWIIYFLAKTKLNMTPLARHWRYSECKFAKARVKYLGHVLDAHGKFTDPEKTEAIMRMPAPENMAELMLLLRIVNHLAKFLLGIAEKTQPP